MMGDGIQVKGPIINDVPDFKSVKGTLKATDNMVHSDIGKGSVKGVIDVKDMSDSKLENSQSLKDSKSVKGNEGKENSDGKSVKGGDSKGKHDSKSDKADGSEAKSSKGHSKKKASETNGVKEEETRELPDSQTDCSSQESEATNKKLPRPDPPVVGKVTHFSIQLYWNDALDMAMANYVKGDGRIRVCLQERDKTGEWGNVYSGYAKQHTVSGLDPQSEYRYRMRFLNTAGPGDWSAQVKVSTTKEPMNGEHLHRALTKKDIEEIDKIIESGDVKIDVPDKFGFSALMQASMKGYSEIVELLLKHGADVHLRNDAGKTALMLACYAGQLDSVKVLRQYGAKYTEFDRGGTAPIHWAVDGGSVKLLDWMIADGADVNLRDLNSEWTPLIRCASVSGHRDVAVTLLQKGADINARDKYGKTAAMLAVLNNHLALLEVLLKKRVDLTIKNENGKTAYEMAVSMEKRRMVKALAEHMEEHNIKVAY